MSELHPVFHTHNSRRGRGNTDRDSNRRTPGPELAFGFLPLNSKTSRINNKQRSGQKVSSDHNHQRHFEPKPATTHQTFSPTPNSLKHESFVSGDSHFETNSRTQTFPLYSSGNVRESDLSKQHSKLNHGLESVRRPTTYSRHEFEDVRNPTRPTENTFNHYYRNFHRNSHLDNNRNSVNTRSNYPARNNNLRSQRPDQTNIVKDNPTYSHPVAGFHSPERKVHHDIREKSSSDPPNLKMRTVLLVKTASSLVTTERPGSAPLASRGFRNTPQHVSLQSEIEHSSKPRIHLGSVRTPSEVSRHRVKHVDFLVSIPNSSLDNGRRPTESLSGSLEGQHSHRLEQSDRNLYYKNDPLLDITEVYSSRFFDTDSKSLESKPDSTSSSIENKSILAIKDKSKSASLENKIHPNSTLEIKNIVVVKDSKPTSTFQTNIYPGIKDRSSSNSENKTSHIKSSPVSFSSSVSTSVRGKVGRRAKMTLKKSIRKKSKEDPEDLDSIPGNPGSDYPTYEEIPATKFDCRDMKSSGYYADMETGCQVKYRKNG